MSRFNPHPIILSISMASLSLMQFQLGVISKLQRADAALEVVLVGVSRQVLLVRRVAAESFAAVVTVVAVYALVASHVVHKARFCGDESVTDVTVSSSISSSHL